MQLERGVGHGGEYPFAFQYVDVPQPQCEREGRPVEEALEEPLHRVQ